MIDILKVTVVFGVMLALLRLKWNVGYVMLVASAVLLALYVAPPEAALMTAKAAVSDSVTIKLFFALSLIRVMEMILREKNVLAAMTEASRLFLRRKKAVVISMPLLIGLLPSLGGAYFSAPMVEESTKGMKMTPEEKGFINYWFRHPWEFILPLYPGILLASAVTTIELRGFITANLLYALLIIVTGFLFGLREVRGAFEAEPSGGTGLPGGEGEVRKPEGPGTRGPGRRLLWSFFPLVFVLALVIVLHVELHYALAVSIVLLTAYYRLTVGEIVKALRHGFAWEVLILIFGTMFFKFSMENSGAVVHLNRFFSESGIPLLPVIFLLPFVTGILTGLTVGFVGGTFPLIVSFAGGAHLNELSFAFAAGFVGVLLSPVHLCLVLTREYFKADAWGIYKKTVLSSVIIMAGAMIEYFVLKRAFTP